VRGPRVKLFPNAQIVPVADAGHHIPHEKPEALAEIVVPFLKQNDK
jgi:pimeloyl-ACP methyl ester carboxylesterase